MTSGEFFPSELPYGELLITPEQVDKQIEQLAGDMIERYHGQNPLFVSILRGAVPFTAKLMFEIARQDPHFHPEVQYILISTYGKNREAGTPQLVMGLADDREVKGRLAVVLDDMLERGITSDFAADYLKGAGASEVELVVMTTKRVERQNKLQPTFSAFEFPPVWATGMGLDDASVTKEGNRWMGGIAIANPKKSPPSNEGNVS